MIDSSSGKTVASFTYDAYGNIEFQPISDKALSEISSLFLMILIMPQAYRGYTYTFVAGDICYYLGSRFYSPRLGRFLNADKHFDTETGVLGTNMYAYCNNNPVMNVDPTGNMSVANLNIVSSLYHNNIVNVTTMALLVLILNKTNIYTAFHEIAQVLIASNLRKKGYSVTLEYKIKNIGEADVFGRYSSNSRKYIWEVKPLGTSAANQLKKYTDHTGLYRGFYMSTISVNLIGKLKMTITFDNNGGAFYAFYIGSTRVKNAQLYNVLKPVIISAYALVISIVVATLVEDVATGGAGIWNDAFVMSSVSSTVLPMFLATLRANGLA